MEKKITFQCPKCGETLSIEARLVSNNESGKNAAGKGSPNASTPSSPTSATCACGNIVIATGKGGKFRPSEFRSTKADQRLAALKAAGVDVSHFFVATGASGEQKLARTSERGLEFVADDDAVFNAIIADERELSDPRLFRRWVLAQMFDALEFKSWRGNENGFTPWLKNKGYEYSFSTMRHELNVQAVICEKDPENFAIRNSWMNKSVALAMIDNDMEMLRDYIDHLRVRHCSRKEYKRIKRVGDVFVSDIELNVFKPLLAARKDVSIARTPGALAKAFAAYCDKRIPMSFDTKMCPEWVDAYKGVGAYYSLENLIKYHGCFIWHTINRSHRSHFAKSMSLSVLRQHNVAYSNDREGYKFLGFLKQFIAENGIDIAAKRHEWAAKK